MEARTLGMRICHLLKIESLERRDRRSQNSSEQCVKQGFRSTFSRDELSFWDQ